MVHGRERAAEEGIAMGVSEAAHEILEKYWTENREKEMPWRMTAGAGDSLTTELRKGGYAEPAKEDARKLELTDKGWKEARSCVRRHRLAERLVADVLSVNKEAVHEVGCKFEHAHQAGVEENICTVLGHPKTCPHGSPIPDGKCCRENRSRTKGLVMPLSECDEKDGGKVAYVRSGNGQEMNKLAAMGVMPGLEVQLVKKVPAFLFHMGESQFAVDDNLAKRIYVRLACEA